LTPGSTADLEAVPTIVASTWKNAQDLDPSVPAG
jgi:hypothetical protein